MTHGSDPGRRPTADEVLTLKLAELASCDSPRIAEWAARLLAGDDSPPVKRRCKRGRKKPPTGPLSEERLNDAA